MVLLSTQQTIDILRIVGYGNRTRTYQETCELSNELYPDHQINLSTLSKICTKFLETGDVANEPKTGRPKSVVTEDMTLNVLLSVQENPITSTRQLSSNLGMSHTSVHKALKAKKFHPYKVQLIHELNEDDFVRRIQFCEEMMQRCIQDPFFKTKIVFSDESSFSLSGYVNRQNSRYWSDENLHWAQECHTQRPQKVNVWAGIVGFKYQVRWGSYKRSKPVGDPSEYTDYEIVHNPEEWKYVERLLPKKWIPIPKPKESYPSGWTPPSADPEKLPYFVERSKNHMLPVYLEIRHRGTQRETKIMRVEGDIWRLSEEIVKHLIPLTGHTTIGCKVEEIKRKITLRGDFVEYTKKFLMDKGF